MSDVDTRQLAADRLGASELLYHQVLTDDDHLKIDRLQAGDFEFDDGFHPSGSQSVHRFEDNGLFIATDRPTDSFPPNASSVGLTSTVAGVRVPAPLADLPNHRALPLNFMVAATFRGPKQKSFIDPATPGEWASVIVVFTSPTEFFAVSAQVRDNTGVRLNLPGTQTRQSHCDLPYELFNAIMDSNDPTPFTLVFHVNRLSSAPSKGGAFLFVGEKQVDSIPCFEFLNGLTSSTILRTVGAGIATGSGGNFRASTDILEFEIWAPTAVLG